MIAEVIVDVETSAVDRVFDYSIPSFLSTITAGFRVLVPFGNRNIEGFILSIKDSTDCPPEKLKSIISALDDYAVIKPELIDLIHYMKKNLYLRFIDGIRLIVPNLIRGGAKEKLERLVFLNPDDKMVNEYLSTLSARQKNAPLIIEYLRQFGKSKYSVVSKKFGSAPLKKLLESGIVLDKVNTVRRLSIDKTADTKHTLTDTQKNAVKAILSSTDKPIVLYGVTGSGKTEVYMNVIEKILSSGKTALMLVPEISLTPQMARVFTSRFGENVAVLHSALSIGERFDEWQRIYKGIAKIVVGARSAIFAPLDSIGVIIIDEEHDGSYVSDSNPRYFTQDIARFRAQYSHCPLVLGSATPSIETFFRAKNGEFNLIEMPTRVNNKPMPKIEVVDMCKEFKLGNDSVLSARMLECLDKTISNGNQAIIFLNRRGFSSYLMCRQCSYIPKCTQCDANLVYHKDENVLKCHYCGKKFKVLTKCPECGSPSIKHGATGTQQIVEILKEHFADVPIFRLDNDTVTTKDAYSRILTQFGNTKPSILVGTQMVTKGHDFPKVTFVGIVDADISLFNYSYKASETTFQLMTQVSGRAGRNDDAGYVVLQTYVPNNAVYRASSNYDFMSFYDKEINLRKTTKFPPFAKIVRILITSESDDVAKNATHSLILKLKEFRVKFGKEFYFMEAMKAPVNKIKNKHRYQIVLRFENSITDTVLNEIYILLDDLKDKKLSIFVEQNPTNLS